MQHIYMRVLYVLLNNQAVSFTCQKSHNSNANHMTEQTPVCRFGPLRLELLFAYLKNLKHIIRVNQSMDKNKLCCTFFSFNILFHSNIFQIMGKRQCCFCTIYLQLQYLLILIYILNVCIHFYFYFSFKFYTFYIFLFSFYLALIQYFLFLVGLLNIISVSCKGNISIVYKYLYFILFKLYFN